MFAMTDSDDKNAALYRYRIEKARRILADAEALHKMGSHGSSVNRSYYAVHAASRALLALRGADPRSHEELRSMMAVEYGEHRRMPGRFMESIVVLNERRVRADYGDVTDIGDEEALDSLSRAREYVGRAGEIGDEKILA